jgi:hypothetical protein
MGGAMGLGLPAPPHHVPGRSVDGSVTETHSGTCLVWRRSGAVQLVRRQKHSPSDESGTGLPEFWAVFGRRNSVCMIRSTFVSPVGSWFPNSVISRHSGTVGATANVGHCGVLGVRFLRMSSPAPYGAWELYVSHSRPVLPVRWAQ